MSDSRNIGRLECGSKVRSKRGDSSNRIRTKMQAKPKLHDVDLVEKKVSDNAHAVVSDPFTLLETGMLQAVIIVSSSAT